jgi:hypothetical protein
MLSIAFPISRRCITANDCIQPWGTYPPPMIDDAARKLVLTACCVDRQRSRFNFTDDLLFESRFKFPSLLSHRPTPCGGLSYPPVEPIAPPLNSQIFSPVNGAQSRLLLFR